MKYLHLLFASSLLTGCCTNSKLDESLKPISSYPPEAEATTLYADPAIKNHFLACRAKVPEDVNGVVNEAISSGKEVLLYFHGGLSGQKYVVNELGPKLLNSVFAQDDFAQRFHPVYMNYDAGPGEHLKALYNDIKATFLQPEYQTIFDYITAELQVVSNTAVAKSADSMQLRSARLLEGFKSPAFQNLDLTESHINTHESYYTELLKVKDLPAEFILESGNGFMPGLYDLAEKMVQLDERYKSQKPNIDKSLEKLTINKAGLRVIRILARYVLNSHHGYWATIQEEILDALGVSKLGLAHWDMVKRHAKQCFADGRNGRALVDALVRAGVKINTLSHSAGSIPTAELVNYMAQAKPSVKLGKVAMLVPAINHKVFLKYVIENDNAMEDFKIYALKEYYEKSDKVFWNLVYSSSLLYAVSSLGEDELSLDQMLMIDQHLDKHRKPYNKTYYQKLACEKPEKVWKYMGASKISLYPFGDEPVTRRAATHGGTKDPWESPDLAKDYLEFYLGHRIVSPYFTEQLIKPVESQWLE